VRNTDDDATWTVDISLNGGILFPDIIGIYMSFTVDPLDKLVVGSGVVKSMVVSVAYCLQSSNDNTVYASVRDHDSQCGEYVGFPFQSSAPACAGTIPVADCGAMASTAIDSDHLPKNVLLDDESFWSPHIRTGRKWKDFLLFDFQTNVRVISVRVLVRREGMRLPAKLSVAVSNTAVSWKTVVRSSPLPEDGLIQVIPAQDTRYPRGA
jgi:hypothetical protein